MLLKNARNFYKGREKIIEEFENGIFLLNYDEREEQESRDREEKNKIRNENGLIDSKKLNKLINLKNRYKRRISYKTFSSPESGSIVGKIFKIKK